MRICTRSINEGFSAGYISNQFDDVNGFQYSILPLSFNLQQKGNTTPNDKGVYKHYVGDHVKGICTEDGNDHTGVISYFYYGKDSKGELVYIVDDKTSNVLPLKAQSVKSVAYKGPDKKQLDYFKRNQNKMLRLDVQGLKESFDFNSALMPY